MVQSNFDAAIEPVEFCREKTGGAAKYEKVVYGEHLVKKVLTNFVMSICWAADVEGKKNCIEIFINKHVCPFVSLQ